MTSCQPSICSRWGLFCSNTLVLNGKEFHSVSRRSHWGSFGNAQLALALTDWHCLSKLFLPEEKRWVFLIPLRKGRTSFKFTVHFWKSVLTTGRRFLQLRRVAIGSFFSCKTNYSEAGKAASVCSSCVAFSINACCEIGILPGLRSFANKTATQVTLQWNTESQDNIRMDRTSLSCSCDLGNRSAFIRGPFPRAQEKAVVG